MKNTLLARPDCACDNLGSSSNRCDDSPTSSKHVISINSEIPPAACEGYLPGIVPSFLTPSENVDFYLPYQDGRERIACSVMRCIDQPSNRNEYTRVGQAFDIDSTKPVIILCHGSNSWRNQMLISFLAGNLTKKLSCHTLRFDFVGNGHSSGKWRYADFDGGFKQLEHVIDFVRRTMKCQILGLL